MLAANAASPEHRPIQDCLAAEREHNRAAFQACVSRAVAAGALPDTPETRALPDVFDTFLAGLSIKARDGVSAKALDEAITILTQVWDNATHRRNAEEPKE